jgi:xylulokinase
LHFSGFADSRKGRWDPSLCRTFGVPEEKLPRIVAPHDTIGEISGSMARKCGLRAGTAVVAGCGDTSASFLACGATREGICVDVAGTASVFAATTAHFVTDLKTQTLCCSHSATPGLRHVYAYVNGGGMNLEWFRETVLGGADFDTLNALAESVLPLDTLPFFVPHLGGRVNPSWPDLRGAWAGFGWSHGPGELYRALLEGVALEYGIFQETLLGLQGNFQMKELRVTGGGERSRIWNRIKAGVLGCPVRQIASGEGAPAGAALLAGFGAGAFADLDQTSRSWTKLGETIKPVRRDRQFSARRLIRYRRLLKALNSWSQL